jgi:hypothetical protein
MKSLEYPWEEELTWEQIVYRVHALATSLYNP